MLKKVHLLDRVWKMANNKSNKIFLTQGFAKNGFPFEIKRQAVSNPYAPMTEKELLAKLKKFGEQEKFRDADDVILDMRSKYGL